MHRGKVIVRAEVTLLTLVGDSMNVIPISASFNPICVITSLTLLVSEHTRDKCSIMCTNNYSREDTCR